MSYSIVSNDIVDVDNLIQQIRSYQPKFTKHSDFFSHCKNVEKFEQNLRANVPNYYQIAEIYSCGKDVALSVNADIGEYTYKDQYPLLKTAIDNLEKKLISLREYAETEQIKISKIYEDSGFNEWSVNMMLGLTSEMVGEIDEILIYIRTIKSSYTYQIQSDLLTTEQVRRLMMPDVKTTNFSGTFENSLISNGDNNDNKMIVNQNGAELAEICDKLIGIIERNDTVATEQKQEFKTIILNMKEAGDQSALKSAYLNFMSFLSNHITVGTAVLGSQLLPELTKLIG